MAVCLHDDVDVWCSPAFAFRRLQPNVARDTLSSVSIRMNLVSDSMTGKKRLSVFFRVAFPWVGFQIDSAASFSCGSVARERSARQQLCPVLILEDPGQPSGVSVYSRCLLRSGRLSAESSIVVGALAPGAFLLSFSCPQWSLV